MEPYLISFIAVAGGFIVALWIVHKSNQEVVGKTTQHIERMTERFEKERLEILTLLKADSLTEWENTRPHPPENQPIDPKEQARIKRNVHAFHSIGKEISGVDE